MRIHKILINILIAVLILACFGTSYAAESVITVHCQDELGRVNLEIFGNNLIAYDPSTYEDWGEDYYGYSDYGAGIWDPAAGEAVNQVIELAKEAGISVMRFPGGCGAHQYNWRDAIGGDRKHFLFGIDEFLEVCRRVGAVPLFTLSYFTGSASDAADFVEYLNAPNDGSNPNGGMDWAKKRAKNGHPEPYGVKYFEIGNEVWNGDHRLVREVKADDYAERYLQYYTAIKGVDPLVQVGVILCLPSWDNQVMQEVGEKADFATVHLYPGWEIGEHRVKRMSVNDIFKLTLSLPDNQYSSYLKDTQERIKIQTGGAIPLAVTEYNVGLTADKPIVFRHSLGAALLNAELLRIFLDPQNGVFMANYWQFCNSFWGMVYSQDDFVQQSYDQRIGYIKRPNQFVYELYAEHFGDTLISSEIKDSSYDLAELDLGESIEDFILHIKREILGVDVNLPVNTRVDCLSVNASINKEKSRVYLAVVNRSPEIDITAGIDLKEFLPASRARVWILNGPGIDATNEVKPDTVRVKQEDLKIEGESFTFEFPAHSFCMIEIDQGEI